VRRLFLLFAAIVLLAQVGQAAIYYVSKSGSDSNIGASTNLSFLTIQKAASVMNAGDTCYILSGIYRETVTPAHSGTSSLPITFAAYPGATPIISGADALNLSWSIYGNSIYQASTTTSFRQLFVDGVMMNEARWPNATVNNLLYAPRSTPSVCTYTYLTDPSLPNVNLVGATLHIFPDEYNNPGYAANTRQITGWNSSTKTISWSGNIFNTNAQNTFYYIYGSLSLLDIPTEWYLDSANEMLYLWTPDGGSPATHVVEVKTRTNAFTLDNRSYITVNGIYVFGAGISMANTTGCVVNGCNLEYVQHNTTADWQVNVPIANQVSGSGSIWENSTITYSSQDGIRCSGQNEMVSNCVIQQVDYYPGTYYAAVTAYSGGNGTKIINNTFLYSGRYLVGASATSVEIASNNLGYGTLLTSDGGATYEYVGGGSGNGTSIHHNWAHNCWAGIYIDQNQNNYLVYRNVCYSNANGMCFNSFTNNLIINNTSVSNTTDILCNGGSDISVSFINNIWNTTQTTFSGNTTLTDNGWFPPLGTSYVPQAGSGAIDHGAVYSPYTDGYIGTAPDIGAYEVGGVSWVPGANFTPQPFPNPYAFPVITTQPVSQANIIGQTATFSVTASSVSSLYYQWCAGAIGSGIYTNLAVGGQFSAVTNATLSISNLAFGNAADYVVVLTNSNGSITSAVATLTVINPSPAITLQPASQTNYVNQTATFTVGAIGSSPLCYQWYGGRAGSGSYTNLIAGGQFSTVTNATLTISNLTLENAADYVVVVTNSYDSITSAVATLIVLTNLSYQAVILGDSPVSYWPMQETAGPTIHDIVSGYNGTLMTSTDGASLGNNQHNAFVTAGFGSSDGATYLLGGPGGLPDVPGDTAIYFTNLNTSVNNSQIVVPYNTALDPGTNFSTEAWIYVPTYPIGYTNTAFQTVLGLEAHGGSANGWWMGVETDWSGSEGDVQFNAAYYPGLSSPPISSSSFSGKWVYAAEVYTGSNSNLLCYTNGVLMATTDMSAYYESEGIYGMHKLPFVIGSYCASYNGGGMLATGFERGDFWHGGISHVAIYNYALTPSQILNHYQVGSTAISPPPPMMSIQASGSNMIVSWTSGFLQQASAVTGPWTYITNAVSPYTTGLTNQAQFFQSVLQAP
jgi:hypothetical protein